MEKLIENINEKIAGIKDENLNSFYKTCIDIFNKELMNPYDELRPDFKAIYIYLLIISEIGLEKSEDVRLLLNKCALFFCNNRFSNTLYDEYYDTLEMIYSKNKLENQGDKNVINDLEFYNNLIIKSIFTFSAEEVIDLNLENDSWMFNHFSAREDNPTQAIIDLFKLCPKKEIFKQVYEIDRIVSVYSNIKLDERFELAIKYYSKNKINKDLNAYVNSVIKENGYHINDNILKINQSYITISKNIKNQNIVNNKIRSHYNKLISFLRKNNDYIDNINKYIDFDIDEDILEQFLKFTIKYNSRYNEKIEKENISLKQRQITNLEFLFNKYNFEFKQLDDFEKRQIQDVENLEKKLKLISEGNLKFVSINKQLFLPLLLNFSIKQISFIDDLYKNNIIDEQFLNDHIIDLSNKEALLNFICNIEFLKNIGINRIARYNKNIFLENADLIKKRYKLFVEVYKIPIDNIYNFEFLENDKIFDMIDNFIELGYFEQIKLNPDYLNSHNLLMIKRLEIAKSIGMATINSDNSFIGSIVSGDSFYASSDELDEFLIDYKDLYLDNHMLDHVRRLDITTEYLDTKFLQDDYTYKIGNTLLSRYRILRNFAAIEKDNSEDSLMTCILYGAINLEAEEIENISKDLKHKAKVK